MASHRYPHKMSTRDRQMKARARATARSARYAQRMMVWGLARGAGSITASIFKAAATLFAVCIVLGLVAVALPYAIGFAVLIAAVVLVVVLVQRHKQQGPATEDPGSQNAPRAAKDEVRLFAACPSCGTRYQFAFRRGCTETVCRCNACGKSFKVESSGAVWPLS